jgi:hypothetical protein
MTEFHSRSQLLDKYPRRCQQFGVCPKVMNRILSVCVEAEVQELDAAQTNELNDTNGRVVSELCPDGQIELTSRIGRKRIICGMQRGPEE